MSKLQGKICVVTGGSRGIGEAIVRRLVADGATVYFTYNSNPESAQRIAESLVQTDASLHGKAIPVQMNITESESIAAVIKIVLDTEKRIDVWVNNAGITRDTLLLRMSEQDWDMVLDTNLKGAFLCLKAVCKPMMSQRAGRIINVGSVVGVTGNAGQVNYSASKAGLIGMTKSLAKELASRNILVNCVAPGFVETDMTAKLTDEQREALHNSIPLKRTAQPHEIASVVSFLSSNDASYITGQTIVIDGGLAM
jgi:3-oxoacyl-[acyl-carrier protein] reductase